MTKLEYITSRAASQDEREAALRQTLRLGFMNRFRDSLMHGRDWKKEDLKGWILTEKFDGVRMFWNGARAWSRQGQGIVIPDWFRIQLPDCMLDGELWGEYGSRKLANRASRSDFSKDIKYKVFDTPGAASWIDRTESLRRLLSECPHANVSLVRHEVVASTNEALQRASALICAGCEGAMVREPTCGYIPGRTASLLKIKSKQIP